MEKRPPLPMTPFDTLATSSELQMIKLLLPYVPESYQRFLAFFIKFSELQNIIWYFSSPGRGYGRDSFRKSPSSPMDIFDDLKPYMGKDADTIDSILSAMNMMQMMNNMDMPNLSQMGDMSGMMDMMNMFAGSTDDSGGSSAGFDNNSKKGNDDYERMDQSSGDGSN